MPIRRSYSQHGDGCATAHAFEVLGDRWTYPVLREVLLGPKRFGELAAAVRGVTPAVLTARLREMQATGLIVRKELPPPANVAVYEATEWARDAAPAFASLARWALRSPTWDQDGGLTPDAAVQSMLAMAPSHPVTPAIDIELCLRDARIADGDRGGGYRYHVTWADRLTIERVLGAESAASAPSSPIPAGSTTRLRADSSAWIEMLYDGRPLDAADIDGSPDDVARLIAAFRGVEPGK